jgi:geranylgeranyl diphosphate synthase, type II
MMKASSERRAGGAEEETEAARRFLSAVAEQVDAKLNEIIPSESDPPGELHEAMRWSLFAGGKRIRPALVYAAGEAFGSQSPKLLSTACAFELVHTYSLIHDDLPSMDDDDLRRGRATCHVKFGEATAILAGDALLTLAFEIIASDETLTADVRVQIINELARAAGTPRGMVAGQALDLAAESRADVSDAELEMIHRHKTGAMICAAARAGAIIAGAGRAELEIVTDYAMHLGLLFQITDDLLDVTASAENLGKTPGKDARRLKATYPARYGLDAARTHAEQACRTSIAALDSLSDSASVLRAIALFVFERRR